MSSQILSENNTAISEYKTLAVTTPKPFVFHVELNRPQRYNAINKEMWMYVIFQIAFTFEIQLKT